MELHPIWDTRSNIPTTDKRDNEATSVWRV